MATKLLFFRHFSPIFFSKPSHHSLNTVQKICGNWSVKRCFAKNATSSESSGSDYYYSSDHISDEEPETKDAKERILHASLNHVHQHGWTRDALSLGAKESGFPGVAHGMFPRGGVELVLHFYDTCNHNLRNDMSDEIDAVKSGKMEKRKIGVFIKSALETRLRMIGPYINTWPQAMGLLATPPNTLDALQRLSTLMDDIWFYAGDKSADFSWYTKRGSLAYVYKSSEVFMLQDKSENFQDTMEFLDRRLEDVKVVGTSISQAQKLNDAIFQGLQGAIEVGRNVVGMNNTRR